MRTRTTAFVTAVLVTAAVAYAVVSREPPSPVYRPVTGAAVAEAAPDTSPPPTVMTPTASPAPTTSPEGAVSPLVLRVAGGHAREWEAVRAAMAAPVFEGPDPWYAYLTYVDDSTWYGTDQREVLARLGERYRHPFVVLVDESALTSREHAVLVVSTGGETRGRAFRALPVTLQSIQNNLSEANMFFEEFAAAAGPGGIFRGF